jgi:hypothetical protein
VVHAGEGQGERWHGEVMPCHAMVSLVKKMMMPCTQTLSILLGTEKRGQRGTKDDLGLKREAKNCWTIQCMRLADCCSQGV